MEDYSICPGCGLQLPVSASAPDPRYNSSPECWQCCGELAGYTLAQRSGGFIHQLLVDTYAAQHAGPMVTPISTAFALIGLYLTFEHGYLGWQVQKVHGQFANRTKQWPRFYPPDHPGDLTVMAPLQVPPGVERDTMLRRWGEAVWAAWQKEHLAVAALVDRFMKG